jgi:hypothetical protein
VSHISLVVNSYERTYRRVLTPGFFPTVAADNATEFSEVVALVNNVDDTADALERTEALLAAGEISRVALVADHLDAARRAARLPKWAFRVRPYFLDYGIVMPHVANEEWVLGWDAEVRMENPTDWTTPAIELMSEDHRVVTANPNWPERGEVGGSLARETVERIGAWCLNHNFSDQVFLARRRFLASPVYRRFSPGAIQRAPDHPFTFEARLEAYLRATRAFRATYEPARYSIDEHDVPLVLDRLGWSRYERLRFKAISKLRRLLDAQNTLTSPRWRAWYEPADR